MGSFAINLRLAAKFFFFFLAESLLSVQHAKLILPNCRRISSL